jgi:high affinity Mn2+ porin
VFKIGKYSIVDIFDTNTYAHDPRNDFLNWSIIDQGAFDYAANVWGYTYGGAVEWYQDWWAARAGVFDLSQAPNTVALSHGFGQGQFMAELEEGHTVWDQPGKLKFLYWLTRGNLGTYLDAISLGEATGTTRITKDKASHKIDIVRAPAADRRCRSRTRSATPGGSSGGDAAALAAGFGIAP